MIYKYYTLFFMIYDFEKYTPKIDPNSWVAPNAVIIGNVELKKKF